MAKRFTDSEKWGRRWFSELPLLAKLVWIYLTDECDSNGVWHCNFKRMNSDIGETITAENLTAWFGAKMHPIDQDKLFIPSFVAFQYGDELSDKNNAHRPVMRFLEKAGLPIRAPYQPLASPPKGAPMGTPGEEEGEGYGYGEGDGEGEVDSSENSPSVVSYQLDTLIARARAKGSA